MQYFDHETILRLLSPLLLKLLCQKLPNLKTAKDFMRTKGRAHRNEVEGCRRDIDEVTAAIDGELAIKFASSQETFLEAKKKYQSLLDAAEAARTEVKRGRRVARTDLL